MKEIKWKCTDPGTQQYGRKISNLLYEFKEENIKPVKIDLEDYTTEQIQNCIKAYGYSLNPASNLFIFNIYPDKEEVLWIIAECLFEYEIRY